MRTRGLAVGRSWMLPLLPLLLLLLLPLLMCEAARGGWVAERVKELRAGVQLLDGYLDSAMEYLGGEDGVCRYTCANGAEPEPRRDYTPAAPNGCGSPVFGIQFDVGVPAMTRCCNDHDRCYDVCGAEKRACDTAFRRCLSRICSLVGASFTISPETLGRCEEAVDLLHQGVMAFGCRPYMESQRAACTCPPRPHGTARDL